MPSAPLAGRPPFATDEPDSLYDSSPSPAKRRVAPTKTDNPNNRTSAYDVYDNYVDSSSKNPFADKGSTTLRPPRPESLSQNRVSGVGGIGMGLLNMDYSDSEDDDSDDDDPPPPRAAAAAKPTTPTGSSKNAALLAAIGNPNSPKTNTFPSSDTKPTLLSTQPQGPTSTGARSPPPIAAPRPGYAAPIAAFNNNPSNPFDVPASPASSVGTGPDAPPGLSPPKSSYGSGLARSPSSSRIPPPAPISGIPMPQAVSIPLPSPSANNNNGGSPIRVPPNAMSRGIPAPILTKGGPPPPIMTNGFAGAAPTPLSMTPAPLQAPATPIMPVFALPKSKEGGISFGDLPPATPRPPKSPNVIMRGNTEETLLPRRGEKGDDFWRRFSMIARDDGGKESSWLRKTRNGTSRLSRWVWVVGVAILLAIVAAVVLGVLLTRGKEESTEPSVLAGNGSKVAATFSNTAAAASPTLSGSRTVLHVSPTHTIGAREFVEAVVTPGPVPGPGVGVQGHKLKRGYRYRMRR